VRGPGGPGGGGVKRHTRLAGLYSSIMLELRGVSLEEQRALVCCTQRSSPKFEEKVAFFSAIKVGKFTFLQ